MSKEYLNNLSIEEIKERLSKGEKIFNETDETSYAKYVDGLGICKFQRKTDRLITINLTLTLFYHLYFEEEKEEEEDYANMIGSLGWFWDGIETKRVLGILDKYSPNNKYPFGVNNTSYAHFQPVKKSELKFWEDEE